MIDTEEQLARLRQRIAAIDSRYAQKASPTTKAPALLCSSIEDWEGGELVANDHGVHFQIERLFSHHKSHGSADIGALCELSEDLLDALGGGEILACSPQKWAFLDTETTGLAGGSGTYAFLIGVGRITTEGFRVKQFFMREYAEERSTLAALHEYLQQFDVLITYNGKSYDQPLLETRYRMVRHKSPFGHLGHLDLLYGARRIWKLRLENCRLVQLEQQILGVLREGDVPGELIPYIYFEYLRSRKAQKLMPVFHHNALDILTLACLTAIVPVAFRSTDRESLAKIGVKHGPDLLGIARWLLAAQEHERALLLLQRAVETGLPDQLMFRTLWEIALLEKKLKRLPAALQIFVELAGCKNEHRVSALEELAKFYEHEERNYALALDFTMQAMMFDGSSALQQRKSRLEKRLARPRTKRLL